MNVSKIGAVASDVAANSMKKVAASSKVNESVQQAVAKVSQESQEISNKFSPREYFEAKINYQLARQAIDQKLQTKNNFLERNYGQKIV